MTPPAPDTARPNTGPDLALILSSGALASQLVMALLIATDRLAWFVPSDQPLTGPEALKLYAFPVIQLVCGLSFGAGAAAAVLALVRLVRRRPDGGERARIMTLVALVLGLVALPAAVLLLIVGAVAATPWSFG